MKMMFWMFLLMSLNGITKCVRADPVCWPGDSNSSISTLDAQTVWDHAVFKGLGGVFVYFCDVDHKWQRAGFAWSANDVDPARITAIESFLANPDKATMISLWEGNISGPAIDDPASPDHDLAPLFNSVSPPDYPPPSGLVTQDTVVYKAQAVTGGGFSAIAVGTVALGKPCDPTIVLKDSTGTYYGIARADVTMTKIGNYTPPFPNTAYGKCT